MNTWIIKYNNDVEPNDEGFCEWEVTDGKKTFKCNEKEDAEWLCIILNNSTNNDTKHNKIVVSV